VPTRSSAGGSASGGATASGCPSGSASARRSGSGSASPSLSGSASASGDLTLSVSTANTGADLNALLSFDLAGQKLTANAEAVTSSSGDVYLQITKLDSLLALIGSTVPSANAYTSLANQIAGKWIKLSKADIDQVTGTGGASATCIQTKWKDSAHADAVKTEMVNLARSHEFVVVKKELGVKSGSVGYQMVADATELKAFLSGFIDTKAFADLQSCSATMTLGFSKAEALKSISALTDTELESAMSGTNIEIWADQWTHRLTRVTIATVQSGVALRADLVPAGDRSSKVKIPTESISLTDLASLLVGN
jgi:hypothetical protein